MKWLSVVLIVACVVSPTFANMCALDDDTARVQLTCIRDLANPLFRARLDNVVALSGCADSLCFLRQLCATGDLNTALNTYFTPNEVFQIRNLAAKCNPAPAAAAVPVGPRIVQPKRPAGVGVGGFQRAPGAGVGIGPGVWQG
ncbi:antimicrobial peptide microplusin [Ixodes scapularis]|uniref:antimicrobial peptide microplusin n=1 Tax=Ixodes scapularis TaxID=6945 RepID=UPI001A9FE4F4|nr:antimicrobial peptide microplusin [Ixodes scapularis]